jgi:Flp pilus assembly protein TadG
VTPRLDEPEEGTAVVEFVLVTIVLVMLFLGLLQLGLALHVRNTLVACAAEGARYAANANRTPQDGAAQTALLIESALSERFAEQVTGSTVETGGVTQVEIRVEATLPLIGFFGPRSLVVTAHSLDEG